MEPLNNKREMHVIDKEGHLISAETLVNTPLEELFAMENVVIIDWGDDHPVVWVSWLDDPWYARCAVRDRDEPRFWYESWGFRLAVSCPAHWRRCAILHPGQKENDHDRD